MPLSRMCIVADVPVEPLWRRLSEWGTWNEWNPRLGESRMEGTEGPHVPIGTVRAVGPEGALRVRERMIGCDALRRVLTYDTMPEPVWQTPARNYQATVTLIPLTDGPRTVIEWQARYDCDLADEKSVDDLLTGLYHEFITGLVTSATE